MSRSQVRYRNGSRMCSRTRVSRTMAIALLLAGIAVGASAQDFRNIASFSFDYNFDNTYEATLENVFLAPLTERTTLEANAQQISASNRSLTMFSLGPVFTFPPNVYTISLYGLGIDGDGNFVHEIDLQANYETASYRVGLGARGRYLTEEDDYYVVPSLSGSLRLPAGFGLRGTYFFSWNSDDEISNALWLEGNYQISELLGVKLGGTVDVGDDPRPGGGNRTNSSAITGATFSLSDSVNLRYHFEYYIRGSSANGIKNLVVVDWRF